MDIGDACLIQIALTRGSLLILTRKQFDRSRRRGVALEMISHD